MADALFCCLCGFPFDESPCDKQNQRISLASSLVEESGLLDRLNITISPLSKELLFICHTCSTVFSNYTQARTNYHLREREALQLLTQPITEGKEGKGHPPFIPYLKRKGIRPPSPSPTIPNPAKVPKLESLRGNGAVQGQGKVMEGEVKREGMDGLDGSSEVKHKVVLDEGCSSSSLSELWDRSREFRDACLSFLSLLIMKETSELVQRETVFSQPMKVKDLQEVCWGPTMGVVSQAAPATLCLLLALLGVEGSKASPQEVQTQHSMVGCILSMVLYKRFRRRANFVPALHSLYLESCRTPKKVKRTLHHVGLSVPGFRVTTLLKALQAPNTDLGRLWKTQLEQTLQCIPRRPKVEEGPKKLPADRRKLRSILPKSVAVTSYGLCWGSVEPGPQHPPSHQPSLPTLSQAYTVKSRVPFMMTYRDDTVRQADNIPFEEFVPDSEDLVRVRSQMKKEVKKVVCGQLGFFAGLVVNEQHQYSQFVTLRSDMVDLGTVFKSPSDSGSVASLMKNLKKYMVYDEGEPLSLCLFGDHHSVDRMMKAKDVMSCFSDKLDRLDGMEPCVGDHGRQVLLAKDIIALFFPGGVRDKYSFLRHMNLDQALLDKCEALDYPALQTLLRVLAETYTVALAERKLREMTGVGESLTEDEKVEVFEQLAEEIVSDVWPTVYTESLDTVRQGNKVVKDRECSFGDCINYKDKARLPCSERCGRPFHLCCHKPLNDGLVECARRENCPRGAWFHINKKCSGLVEAPEDEWFCGSCLASKRVDGLPGRMDGLWEYHRGLLWYCLFFLAGEAAEGSGDGWLLHAIWKVSMPLFETQGHTDYLHLGYSFLSGVAGRIPRLAAHDSLHNRTINLTGGHNTNMSWDRAVHHIREQTKGRSLQRVNRKEPNSPRRAEAYRLHTITTALETQLYPHPQTTTTATTTTTTTASLRTHIEHLEHLGVLNRVPGRQRVDDIEYTHVIRVRKPGVMVTTLRELCAKDVTRQMSEQESEVE